MTPEEAMNWTKAGEEQVDRKKSPRRERATYSSDDSKACEILRLFCGCCCWL